MKNTLPQPRRSSSGVDAKTIAAIAALVTALAGGVEMRVQVGLIASRIDRLEAEVRAMRYVAEVD